MKSDGDLIRDLSERVTHARIAGAEDVTLTPDEFERVRVLAMIAAEDRPPTPAPDPLEGLRLAPGQVGLLFGFPFRVA